MGLSIHRMNKDEDGTLYIETAYGEYTNINQGKIRAVLVHGSKQDDIDGKTFTVRCLSTAALMMEEPSRVLYETRCVVKSVHCIRQDHIMMDVMMVSIQPVAHRRREINRRKSYRQLHAAYERMLLKLYAMQESLLKRRGKLGREE